MGDDMFIERSFGHKEDIMLIGGGGGQSEARWRWGLWTSGSNATSLL
jgi:hypothetical protein